MTINCLLMQVTWHFDPNIIIMVVNKIATYCLLKKLPFKILSTCWFFNSPTIMFCNKCILFNQIWLINLLSLHSLELKRIKPIFIINQSNLVTFNIEQFNWNSFSLTNLRKKELHLDRNQSNVDHQMTGSISKTW